MNEFTAKKLGEVLAFARVLAATLDKGGEALSRVIDTDVLNDIRSANEQQMSTLEEGDAYANAREAILLKAQKTQQKISEMQNLYLADEEDWSDPAELMEWLGFFEGAAMVHWNLVVGAAETTEIEELVMLAKSGYTMHFDFLDAVSQAIKKHGIDRAAA